MKKEIFQKILSDHRELSSLPQVVAEVIRVSGDPKASAGDLADVVMKDPGLTAKLLRVVNSPYYAPASQISTVRQAVVTLGLRTVTAVTLATSIYSLIGHVNTTVDRKKFWRHSLEVALASRMIAENINFESPDEAFVAGLLHDIGMLILEASFPEEFAKMWHRIESGEGLINIELEIWGTDHPRVGQFLLQQWNLPENICSAVGNHHQVFHDGEGDKNIALDKIVNLGNMISKFRINSMSPPEPTYLENKRILAQALNISHAKLADIEKNLISDVVRESGFLEIEIGNMEDILHDANQMLYRQYVIAEDLLRENMEMQQRFAENQAGSTADESVRELIATFSQFIAEVGQLMNNQAMSADSIPFRGEIQSASENLKKIISEGTATISYILDEMKRLSNPDKCVDVAMRQDVEQKISLKVQKFSRAVSPVEI